MTVLVNNAEENKHKVHFSSSFLTASAAIPGGSANGIDNISISHHILSNFIPFIPRLLSLVLNFPPPLSSAYLLNSMFTPK